MPPNTVVAVRTWLKVVGPTHARNRGQRNSGTSGRLPRGAGPDYAGGEETGIKIPEHLTKRVQRNLDQRHKKMRNPEKFWTSPRRRGKHTRESKRRWRLRQRLDRTRRSSRSPGKMKSESKANTPFRAALGAAMVKQDAETRFQLAEETRYRAVAEDTHEINYPRAPTPTIRRRSRTRVSERHRTSGQHSIENRTARDVRGRRWCGR